MKKHIIKTVSCVLVFVLSLLTLSSCSIIESYIDSYIDAHTSQRPENEMYGAVKVLYSYEEVMDALSIVRKRVEVNPVYTVYDMGENYTVLYYFFRDGKWAEYPLDYEDYFNNISTGKFLTFIFVNDMECPHHKDSSCNLKDLLRMNKFDENYESVSQYYARACVLIYLTPTSPTYTISDIEDTSWLSYHEIEGSTFVYYVYYCGEQIMELYSCVKLGDKFFSDFFDSIVTTE